MQQTPAHSHSIRYTLNSERIPSEESQRSIHALLSCAELSGARHCCSSHLEAADLRCENVQARGPLVARQRTRLDATKGDVASILVENEPALQQAHGLKDELDQRPSSIDKSNKRIRTPEQKDLGRDARKDVSTQDEVESVLSKLNLNLDTLKDMSAWRRWEQGQ